MTRLGFSVLLVCLTTALTSSGATKSTASSEAISKILSHAGISTFEILPGDWWISDPIHFRAVVSLAASDKPLEKGNWSKLADALSAMHADPSHGVQLEASVLGESDAQVWHDRKPLNAVALADASAKLVPGDTIWSLRDPAALIDFSIPANTLTPGFYRVLLKFLTPDGSVHNFPDGSTLQTASSFHVVASDSRKLLPATVTDAPTLMRSAMKIASPARKRFPLDTPDDCQARSVWSLRAFEGKVYCGYGDWARNRGPIDVWSFEPRTAATDASYPPRLSFRAGKDDSLVFLNQFVVQEESIEDLRAFDGKLIIPGIDGCKEVSPPDSHLFGNIYIREAGFWRKLSTLPKAAHVMDAFLFSGQLFAYVESPTGDLFVSNDMGITWKPLTHDPDFTPTGFAQLGTDLVVVGGNSGLCRYRDGKLERHHHNLLPGTRAAGTASRSTPFKRGLVYTLWHNWDRVSERSYPLYFLKDLDEEPTVVSVFKDATVKDILVDGDKLCVLISRPKGDQFIAEVFETADLSNWKRITVAALPATPSALAKLGSNFFIGLANRGYDPATYSDYHSNAYAHADKAAGEIWQLMP